MQKTENYQLCQWAASDRVLMEDFNGDNAKLEAALTGLAAADAAEQSARAAQDTALAQQISQLTASIPIVKLLDQSVTSEQTRLDVSLSQIDCTQYAELVILPMLVCGNLVHLTCNQVVAEAQIGSSPYWLGTINTTGAAGLHRYMLRLLTYGQTVHFASEYQGEDTAQPFTYKRMSVTAEQLVSLHFVPANSGTIKNGSRVVIWGLRL